MEEGLFVPVQYVNGRLNATIVIHDNQVDKDGVEEMLCTILGIKKTVGNVQFGDAMTAGEALAYNRGFEVGVSSVKQNVKVIDGPDIYLDGEKVISAPKKRKTKISKRVKK